MRGIYLLLIALAGLATTAIAIGGSHETAKPSGEAIFETSCANCHTGGIGGFISGAPDIDDEDDGETLTPKGVDALTATTIAGVGKMEPRGACPTCTDEDIREAVAYMLAEIQ